MSSMIKKHDLKFKYDFNSNWKSHYEILSGKALQLC